MDSPYSPLEFSLLNEWQHDFPLVSRPFEAVGAKVGAGGTAVLAALQRLNARGAISRIGPVFAPRRVGAGALAAVAAPLDRLEEIAARISADAQVNHNYQREHEFNLWFVVTAADETARAAVLAGIERDTGCAVISMPLRHEFHIDLGFDLRSGHTASPRRAAVATAARTLTDDERALAASVQTGIPFCDQPYAELANHLGQSEGWVLERLTNWSEEGLVKRFGVVVRHHELGYRANAMVVFDVADDQVERLGELLAAEQGVTLCYCRERCLPAWRYNLYCMVHGRSRDEVAPTISRLAQLADAEPNVLFSLRRFKQCGARYFS
jgi:DNA-binding Lrp family transcriptional regulator